MNEAPATIPIERTGQALIARPQTPTVGDPELKALIHTIEQSAGPDSGVSVVVLDLSAVHMLPSLSLGLLLQISSRCKARQQKLKLAAVRPELRQVFSITRLDRLLEFAPSVNAAIM